MTAGATQGVRLRTRVALSLLVTLAAIAAAAPGTTHAATLRPHWAIVSTSAPTYFKAGDEGDYYEVIAVNDGGAPTDGSSITVTAEMPSETTATVIHGDTGKDLNQPMTCPTLLSCTTEAVVAPAEAMVVKIIVSVDVKASGGLDSQVTVSGGGAQTATARLSTPVSSAPVPFAASMTTNITGEGGTADTQAGSHSFALTSTLAFNVGSVATSQECVETPGCPVLNADVKDVEVALPAGVVGNPQAVPRCSQTHFQTFGFNNCPADTQVGGLLLFFYGSGTGEQYAPVYNVEPPPGQSAELGFTVAGSVHIPMFFHVRSDGDYGLTAQLAGISEADPPHIGILTIWGIPAAQSHDSARRGLNGAGCDAGCASGVVAKPFLRLPTSCTAGELEVPLRSDSWQDPQLPEHLPQQSSQSIAGMTGCEDLPFGPSILIRPDTFQAHAPAGYTVSLQLPQNEDPEGLSAADVRDTVVTLPPGTVISPSAANGLATCSGEQFELRSSAPGNCPKESTLGTLSITTPLLEAPLAGHLFVGQPGCSPCNPADAQSGRMLPLLLEAEGPGVTVKLAGHTSIDQATGQLTTTFRETPQLPFSSLTLGVKGGPGALLVNPSVCGDATATALLTPWSAREETSVSAPAIPISGCTAHTFEPSLQAGMTETAQAGAYSDFEVSLSRPDGQQALAAITVNMPPGLLGTLATVAPCGEAQANAGTCPAASEIGTASTTIGAGSEPYEISGGKVFLTGPYRGRPFGLAVVLPAVAGPFTLAGNTGRGVQVVRAAIGVDPATAALTVSSDELPHALNGIPLEVDRVVVDVNRHGFMFNPTSCAPMSIRGSAAGTAGATVAMSYPFQAVNCATLPFKPKFTALTQAGTSKANGASLHVKVTSGPGQANIGKVKVDLPRQLPSRLTTLQKACPDPTFKANPASCSASAVVGSATAVTPVLKNPLTGPAYLVSHAGAAFPDLVIVLQGEGVTLDLVGNTDIKKGVTISTFNSVPDAPVSTFDLVLPEGPHSALGAFGNLCRGPLNMPTAITGQNGAVIKQTTRIAVSGCPRHKAGKARSTKRGNARGKAHSKR